MLMHKRRRGFHEHRSPNVIPIDRSRHAFVGWSDIEKPPEDVEFPAYDQEFPYLHPGYPLPVALAKLGKQPPAPPEVDALRRNLVAQLEWARAALKKLQPAYAGRPVTLILDSDSFPGGACLDTITLHPSDVVEKRQDHITSMSPTGAIPPGYVLSSSYVAYLAPDGGLSFGDESTIASVDQFRGVSRLQGFIRSLKPPEGRPEP